MSDAPHWVLVVHRDQAYRDGILTPGLERAGFRAVGVGTAVDAFRCMLSRNYSLFVLDDDSPGVDGQTLAGRLRTVTDAGIVTLAESPQRNNAHNPGPIDGADVRIAKPIDIDALAAALRNLLRPKPADADRNAASPKWRLATAGWDLFSPGGAQVPLTQPERLLLSALAAACGRAVARDDLISRLARDAKFDGHRLEMLVHRLRRKVLSATGEALPLKAVRGVGYALFL